MMRSALAEVRAYPARFAAVCLAIVLGVGFAAATLVFTSSFNAALGRSVAAEVSKADVVVSSAGAAPLQLAKIAAVPGVEHLEPSYQRFLDFRGESSRGYLELRNIPADPAARWYSLAAGRWPSTVSELAVDIGTATRNSWHLGSRLTLGSPPDARQITVTAIVDTRVSPLADATDSGYAAVPLLVSLPGTPLDAAKVNISPGFSADQVAASISAALGGAATAQTAAEVTEQAVRQFGNDTDVVTLILLAFVTLAALVAALVVANTFTILITQRRRQIALLRCIGATGSQVRRSALTEAGLLAVVGSLLGVGVGVGVGRIACAVAGITAEDFTVDGFSMVVLAVLGIAVTVVAAVAPTARAMRIPPMAALRPVEGIERVRMVSRWRIAAGLALLLGGGALLGGGVVGKDLAIATGGGALTAVGVLLVLRVVLPRVLSLASGVAVIFGAPGRLAVGNMLRNPGRAAATCTALVVGIGAVVTLLVAAASAQAGADQAIGARNPLDLQVVADQGALPTSLPPVLARIEGIQAAIAVPGTEVQFEGGQFTAFGPSADQLGSVRNGGELANGEAALPAYLAEQYQLHPGDPVKLRRGAVTVILRLAAGVVTDDNSIVLLGSDLRKLDSVPVVKAVWGKFAANAAPDDVMARVNKVVVPFAGVEVSGSGAARAATADLVGTVLKVALALLAVAVVIAVLGIGNTLGLSVVERTRESALLRALGLRRTQLREMLALEAALLALVAAVVGTFFGIIFGWAAVAAAFGQAGESVLLTIPAGRLLMVFAAAVLAAMLASVLPGRRAAMATPVQALVEV